ncbi:hypothetical protein Pla110_42730 [Polystyrenella longa]|uniref:Uncharacterized protein n=1 Tax=Polystyrenella longa TaxID=2528007 RepID=A0A518CTH2_9PLAN|nr:hypothetical protein Pla110_42730 [Polystyrenella longa]
MWKHDEVLAISIDNFLVMLPHGNAFATHYDVLSYFRTGITPQVILSVLWAFLHFRGPYEFLKRRDHIRHAMFDYKLNVAFTHRADHSPHVYSPDSVAIWL